MVVTPDLRDLKVRDLVPEYPRDIFLPSLRNNGVYVGMHAMMQPRCISTIDHSTDFSESVYVSNAAMVCNRRIWTMVTKIPRPNKTPKPTYFAWLAHKDTRPRTVVLPFSSDRAVSLSISGTAKQSREDRCLCWLLRYDVSIQFGYGID